MPGKRVLNPFVSLENGDMSGNLESEVTNIATIDNVSIQLVWTGTPTGSFYVDGSADGANWTPLSLSPAPIASGAAGNWLIDMTQLSFLHIRVRYVASSGSGSLTVTIAGKGL